MNTRVLAVFVGAISVLLAAGCGGEKEPSAEIESAAGRESGVDLERATELEVTSTAFSAGGTIPERHTCDGENVSPPLSWGEAPAGTRSFALVMDDPDAMEVAGKVWVHWVIYNVPARAQSLAEGIPRETVLPGGARQAEGSSGMGYHGPCPPPERRHRYFFKLYALDKMVDPNAVSSKADLLGAIEGHVLAHGELMGEYSRP